MVEQGGCELRGRVYDGAGEPVPDAMVELWQADEHGVYRGDFGWARCGTGADGSFELHDRQAGPGRRDRHRT